MEMAMVTNRPAFINKQLEKATQMIQQCDLTIKTRQYDIADALAQIEEKNLYVDDGFTSCAEYAMSTFGIQKSTAYLLITIGREYTRKVTDDKGRCVGHCSNLVPAGTGKTDAPILDFTTNQIGILATLGRDVIVESIKVGSLHPSMKASELREFVKLSKAVKAGTQDQAQEQAQDQAQEQAQDQAQEQAQEQDEVIGSRSESGVDYDNIPSCDLIAELIARGFRVTNQAGRELRYIWKV